MDHTILLPSPTWFQVSVLAVTSDNWLIYGGPGKSLCVLEPQHTNADYFVNHQQAYKAHVYPRGHAEKIVSVDISPEWPSKRSFLTGSASGSVKQWILVEEKSILLAKSDRSHEFHTNEKEELVGVCYCDAITAVSIGTFSILVKWDLESNVVKPYTNLKRSFKPTCIAVSPHLPMQVAIGTKQGVIVLIDISTTGKILYKVRGQDEDIINISWCPEYEVLVKKLLDSKSKSKKGKGKYDKHENSDASGFIQNVPGIEENTYTSDSIHTTNLSEDNEYLNAGCVTSLPEDSFGEVVEEDDMFNIYEDHADDEFGHKKYQPEDIIVPIKEKEAKENDFLAECNKLKEEILKRKNNPSESIESLVQAMDNTHVSYVKTESSSSSTLNEESTQKREVPLEGSLHIQKHLLASVGKNGYVCIWSKSGKLVASCYIAVNNNTGNNNYNNKNYIKTKSNNWPTLLWHKADTLLFADGKNQLGQINPLIIDSRNKLEWNILHSLHKRGLYCIKSNAPSVQTPKTVSEESGKWSIWTVAQDRYLINYDVNKMEAIATHATCGGFLYNIQPCPYDSRRIAVSVGDGAVRVIEMSVDDKDETKLVPPRVTNYWQNVQGKVLNVAWHPTRENLLAFSTAESRVGVIDLGGRQERPARTFVPALRGGVYALCWGAGMQLLACASGDLVAFRADRPDDAPTPVELEYEGRSWAISEVRSTWRGLLVGSNVGAVAMLDYDMHIRAATYVFNKIIHTAVMHPLQTTSSSKDSPNKNLIACCSLDRTNNIAILEFSENEDGSGKLQSVGMLNGHSGAVLLVDWNPHMEGQLLSTSQDATVRVWDARLLQCTAVFAGHSQSTLGAAWSPWASLAGVALSGGADCCLRMWSAPHHPPEKATQAIINNSRASIKQKKKKEMELCTSAPVIAPSSDTKVKGNKKFLLPIIYKQSNTCCLYAVKKHLETYTKKNPDSVHSGNEYIADGDENEMKQIDFLKMFGSNNDVNELLDMEMENLFNENGYDAWMLLGIFRGRISEVIEEAAQKDMLCSFLVSLAPCVSLKFWREASRLHIAQMDRFLAQGKEDCPRRTEVKTYGGLVLRKAATLLSINDIKGAVNTLISANLFKEAYILCRVRYLDSLGKDILWQWAEACLLVGNFLLAAVCYICLDDLNKAAASIGRSKNQNSLIFAADLAKMIDNKLLATHMETKAVSVEENKTKDPEELEEPIKKLPSRMELLMQINESISSFSKVDQNDEPQNETNIIETCE